MLYSSLVSTLLLKAAPLSLAPLPKIEAKLIDCLPLSSLANSLFLTRYPVTLITSESEE